MAGISTKVGVGFLVGGALTAAIVAGMTVGSLRLGEAVTTTTASASMLREHTLVDMLHDTLRGDVFAALYKASREPQGREAAVREVKEHAADMAQKVAAVAAQHPAPAIAESLRAVGPVVQDYTRMARDIVERSYEDPAAAQAMLPAFEKQFETLEGSLDAVGTQIEDQAHALAAEVAEDRVVTLYAPLAGAALLFAVFGAGFWACRRWIVRPLALLGASLQDEGSDAAIETLAGSRSDEIGRLAQSVLAMHRSALEIARIRASIDGAPTMLIITDPNEHIVYMSRAATALFRLLEPAFRAADPGFAVADMTGRHIDYYRKNAALKRELLFEDSQTRAVRYEVGGRIVELTLSYIRNASGGMIGHNMVLEDVTAQKRAEAEVAAVAAGIAAGDLSRRVPVEGKEGFIGTIAGAINAIADTVDTTTAELASVMGAMAEGDLTRTVETHHHGRFGELGAAANGTVARLAATVATLQGTALDVDSAAREIHSGASDLSSRTEQQASSLEETAATTEELAASVKATAQASRQAVNHAEEARIVAREGGAMVGDAVNAMSRIEQASAKISEITDVIEEIAFQTNLLALNAAVEAARAGDAGKGFAVVAAEVRTLAQRSSDAAKDIGALIVKSTGEVSEGVKLVRDAGATLSRLVEAAGKVADSVNEISSATAEQASGIDEMSQAIAHMDAMTQQNAALAEQSSASATSLSQRIEELARLIGQFRTRQKPADLGRPAAVRRSA